MADQKISALDEKLSINNNDNLPIVDSEAEPIQTKKIKFDVIYDLFALVGHNHAGVYEPAYAAGLATQYYRGDKAWATLNQAAVAGLTTGSSPTFAGLTLTGKSGIQKATVGVIGNADPAVDYQPFITAGTTVQYWRGDKAWQTLNQAAVAGLTTADGPTFNHLHITANVAAATLNTTGDATISGELLGSRTSFVLSNLNAALDYTAIYMKAGEVMMSATKGLLMPRAGSIVGISLQYDVTVDNAASCNLVVYNDGVSVWSNAISHTVANDKEAYFTQARGTDTFTAGQVLMVRISQGAGAKSTFLNMICTLEVQFDT